jgi:hypothetical protein
MPNDTTGGPYVQVAAICTTPLIEQQGLLSVIRVQDRIQLAGPTEQMQPQPLNSLWCVISLKSGDMQSQATMHVTLISPRGEQLGGPSFNVLFEGQERGAVIAFPLPFVVSEQGLYWFEVTLEGVLLTKIPLRVMYQRMQAIPAMPFHQPPTD